MTQTVVITGASAGIARATARLYGAWLAVSLPGLRWPARCWFGAWQAVRDACTARPDG